MAIHSLTVLNRLANGYLRGRYKPLFAELSITLKCNYDCAYCDQDRAAGGLPLPELRLVIDRLAEAGVKRVSLTGGEPFLRKDLEGILDHVAARGMKSAVVTNGSLILRKEHLVERFSEICISLDGIGKYQGTNRVPSRFEDMEAAIDCVLRHGVPLKLSFIISRWNAAKENIDLIFDYCNRRKIHFLITFAMHDVPYLHDKNDKNVLSLLDEGAYHDLINYILEIHDSSPYILISRKAYLGLLHWPDTRMMRMSAADVSRMGIEDFSPKRCHYGKYSLFVGHDGQVAPCCMTTGIIGRRNLLTDSVEDVLGSVREHDCLNCYNVYYTHINHLLSWEGLNVALMRRLRHTVHL